MMEDIFSVQKLIVVEPPDATEEQLRVDEVNRNLMRVPQSDEQE